MSIRCHRCSGAATTGSYGSEECDECGEMALTPDGLRRHLIEEHGKDLETCNCIGCYREPNSSGHCSMCPSDTERGSDHD